MGKVFQLDQGKEELIGDMESLVERVRKGEVIAVAWALVNSNGTLVNGWNFTAKHDGHALTASVADLQYRMSKRRLEDSEDEADG